ncbi:uncharacterized protein IL334_006231 [Kwoniella shivajii]|uniref:Uncharacterized protein n=1 Tax=Kwoniella shivajii TaxID=564305 RepID=A0ABZ1D5D3_9TREE|nr:hypothetical protein IL334_006231 [Kwoniella shivajii]
MTTTQTLSSIPDNFINSKAQSSRRISSYDSTMNNFPRRLSTTLAVVPENHGQIDTTTSTQSTSSSGSSVPSTSRPLPVQSQIQGSSSSSNRLSNASINQSQSQSQKSVRPQNQSTRSSVSNFRDLDKDLEMAMRRSPGKNRTKSMDLSSQPRSKSKRADWVIDLLEAQKGVETWIEDQRVILVLGDASPSSLAPILHDPAFSDTLLLVGSREPLPAIEALLSPSHLMSSSPEQQIFPTVQPFNSTAKSDDTDVHALTVLLAQATIIAQQYRSKPRGWSSLSRPRTESFASSSASNSPPSTPPMRKRVLPSFGLNTSSSARSSLDSNASTSDRPRSASVYDANSAESTPRPNATKNRKSGRESIFGGLRRNSDSSEMTNGKISATSNGSLFDAVINFVPNMNNFKPERALQDMLHQSVVVTTGIMPSLTAQVGKSTSSPINQMPISLIHVLPQTMPIPLPSVIESFLLSLLPTFQHRCPREIFGSVVSSPVWLSPFIDASGMGSEQGSEDVSASQVLLFGGVRCPYQVLDSTGDYRPRAFLSSWKNCIAMPGLISQSRNPTNANSVTISTIQSEREEKQQLQLQLQNSLPPSIAYKNVKAKTPHSTQSRSPSPPKKSSLPRSVSMPISSSMSSLGIASVPGSLTQTTKRSKLHVSHTPPISEDDLELDSQGQKSGDRNEVEKSNANPESNSSSAGMSKDVSNPPSTPDLDPSSISSCASSDSPIETGSNNSNSRRESEICDAKSADQAVTQEKPAIIVTGNGNGKRTLKNWFRRNRNGQ